MRRPTLFLVGIILTLTLFSSSAWAVLQCGENLAGATTILKISAPTNAHGEIYSQSNYTTNINCRETSGVSVGPTQPGPSLVTLLKLSANTNAHAETAGGVNYNTPIQMGDNAAGQILVTVVDSSSGATTNECNDFDTVNADYVDVVRINNLTNAHLQSPSYAGTKYRYIVCAAYDASGSTPAPENIAALIAAPNNPGSFPIPANGSAIIDLNTQNQVYNDVDYSNLAVLQVTFVCDTADTTSGVTGETCASMTDYVDARTETNAYLTGATNTIMRIPTAIKVDYYKNSGDTSAWDNIYANYTGVKQLHPTIDGIQNTIEQFTIDTSAVGMNLPAGNYKIITVLTPVEYDRVGVGPDNLENVAFFMDNVDTFTFAVLPGNCGNLTIEPALGENCDPPGQQGACNTGYTCNSTCTQCIIGGGGTQGLAGDVFVLKNITFPNVYMNNDIVAELTIENKDTTLTGANPTATINVIIRNSKGNMVGPFIPAQFTRTINGAADTESILVQSAAQLPFLNVGETYTLYATIVPYDNANPSLDEKIITNNSGFKTFTAINAPQAYSVPDTPWWMSLLIVMSVMGFLFAQTRKKND